MQGKRLKGELDRLAERYDTPAFLRGDPLQLLWHFQQPRDIEVAAMLIATNTWGRRDLIIRACGDMLAMMGNKPFQYVWHGRYEALPDTANLYRTFFGRDLKYVCRGLRRLYGRHDTLEDLFVQAGGNTWEGIALLREALRQGNPDAGQGYNKHIANPRTSACKRLHLMLRWLVRDDGVDRGIWKRVSPASLMIPMDTHVLHVARHMGLLKQRTAGRKAVEDLTSALRRLNPEDPVRYDYALFGYGIEHGI